MLKKMYKEPSIILFGDLNIKREKFKKVIEENISPYGFNCWYKKEKEEYTRCSTNKENIVISKSYLDCFITYGVEVKYFDIKKEMEFTDHKGLEKTISDKSCGKLQKMVNIIDKFQPVKKEMKK